MSSRALRKLHGSDDLKIPDLLVQQKDEEIEPVVMHKKVNLFSMLDVADEINSNEVSDDSDNSPAVEVASNVTSRGAKKKKKRARKAKKSANEADSLDVEEMLNVHSDVIPAQSSESSPQRSSYMEVLQVQHKFLNPANEMKRRFGQKVVNVSENRRRDHKVYKKSTHMVIPASGWHPIVKSGFGMVLQGDRGDCQVFTIEHKLEYQKVQYKFWEAVDSLNPENIMAILQLHPYHIDSLLQLSEVCRMSEDLQMAAELIERAIYAVESNLHPLFSFTSGKCRLDYKVWENRGFFLALYRHLRNIGTRGCHRTALEYCKLLLSLDPDDDPLCVLLMIDFYALMSGEYEYLINLYNLWDVSRNLNSLPNFSYSVPLAMFHSSEVGSEKRKKADAMLQDALSMFPGVLSLMLDACGIDADADKNSQKYFGAHVQYGQPASLKQLVNLYVNRTSLCWKAPECMTWLEQNAKAVYNLAQNDPRRYNELSDKGKRLYIGKAPLNVYRHLLTCEVTNATVDIPLEFTHSAVLSYDPLPPQDTIQNYEKPSRPARQIDNQGFLAAFFNSLRPDFDIDAPAQEGNLEAAAGVHGRLQDGVGNLMNAIRELMNNIELAPAPRDAPEEANDQPHDWDQDD